MNSIPMALFIMGEQGPVGQLNRYPFRRCLLLVTARSNIILLVCTFADLLV